MPPKTQAFTDRQQMQTHTFEIFRYKDANPKDVALHHHDFYEIYFFLSGSVLYNIESRSYLLTPGDILLIRPMQLHQPIFDGKTGNYERIVLWLNRNFLDQFGLSDEPMNACFHTILPSHAGLLRPDEHVRQKLLYMLELLLAEQTSTEYGHEISCFSYLALILSQLCRLSSQEPLEVETSDVSKVVYDVLEYINENFQHDLSLDTLANRFFVSKYHLSREFTRVTGSSVHRYVTQRRLITAKQMMSEGKSTSSVCQLCGFGDYSSFYRAFKAAYQISPREFALRLKKLSVDSEERNRFLREYYEK
ncbi:MAG: helix-turn-helix domain-containing protein [Oscillospiraceae bacterium]|nr:helix-turn-helix domain-containing protein [Oscillospiraceae bacterium]